ncbi:hypothetical protein OSB04_009724 [Centaurea solstitialis]|uniref:Uncharacterized protein n=1 Tax=Centaurea solstitialis TaxID=347529 RepID=A0AA38WJY9_9ASTR|nr:hypothetical protein OSB04_009724 [Centaurea solstitialis]
MQDLLMLWFARMGGRQKEMVINFTTIDDLARTYNQNLVEHVSSCGTTPKKPNKKVETYVFALFNEGSL